MLVFEKVKKIHLLLITRNIMLMLFFAFFYTIII